MNERFYVMPIEGGEPELVGPYPDFDTMLVEARKYWAEMNQQMDTISYLYMDAKGEPSVSYFTNEQMDPDDDVGYLIQDGITDKTRPTDCECDNTHEHNDTCCRPCWSAGFRRVQTKADERAENG